MNPINVLIGRKVTVYSRLGETEKQDVGIVEIVEGDWIRLKKSDGDTLFFSIANVRMLKPFEPL